MAAPQGSAMAMFAKQQFASFQITVPQKWQDPQDKMASDHYPQAFEEDEKSVPSPIGMPLLFQTATANRYHTDNAQELHDRFSDYFDGICAAICQAWSAWQSAAAMSGVVVNAVTASGGQLTGPPWLPVILGSAPMDTDMEAKYSKAIAGAIHDGWQSYQSSINVPGLPWYPSFAAVPAPVAPPAPNTPVPVAALAQVTASVGKPALKQSMISSFGDPQAQYHKELFDAVADAFEKCFQIWQASTMVTEVIGTGPVPSFNPPWVPVGPVVGGTGTMPPGGLK